LTLALHSRLGQYEILAPLGAGGMGEVYRAVDHALGREVAIKTLPQEFAADSERLARDAPSGRGGTWTEDGNIIFAPRNVPGTGLSRVPAAGGTPQPVTTPDVSKGERSHRWPEVLPGGRAVLFTIEPSPADLLDARVAVLPLDGGPVRVLLENATAARYVSAGTRTGWLVAVRGGGLVAASFDAERLELAGQPVPVGELPATNWGSGAAQYAVSRTTGGA
jgi:hypothetical protein